jgi:hypothetical protein
MSRPSFEPLSSSSFSLLALLPLRTSLRLALLRLGNAMDIEGEQAQAQAQGRVGLRQKQGEWEADSMYVPQRVRAHRKVDARASISVLRLDKLAALA